MSADDHSFRLGDLVELQSEAQWNHSLFRIIDIQSSTIILGQLSHDGSIIGVDTAIDMTDPEDRSELVHARPEILAEYPTISGR